MKRRHFVIRSGMATVTLATSNFSLANFQKKNSDQNCNIGIIGIGKRGTELISYITEIPNFNVVSYCDIIPSRLENVTNLNESAVTYHSDYRKLLAQDNVDAILISTPYNSHAKITMDALYEGKHVYCESTLAKGYDGISNVLSSSKTAKPIVQVGHQFRNSNLCYQVRELVKKGTLGRVLSFECTWNVNGDWRNSPMDNRLEKLINWRMYREFSGGLTAELCSHQIDFVNWILDTVPEKVTGKGGNDYISDNREIFDNIELQYTYPDNIPVKFSCKTSSDKASFEIKINGNNGTIILDLENAWIFKNGQKTTVQVDSQNPSKQALIDFKDCILEQKPPFSNIVTGAKTAIAVQMGIDALITKKTIYWPSKLEL